MKKKILIVVALAGAAFAVWHLTHRNEFLYAGTVEATKVDISPRLSTTIKTMTVKEGDAVKADQVLVTLDGEEWRIAAEVAQKDYDRADRLRKTGSITEEAFDRLRFKKDDATIRYSYCVLRSPIDGVVLDRNFEPGELVNPGMKILTLADLREVWAIVYVPASVMAQLQVNATVEAVVPELGEKTVSGRISHISSEAEFTPKNVQTRDERARLIYGVKILFTNTDNVLKPGMTVEARLAH